MMVVMMFSEFVLEVRLRINFGDRQKVGHGLEVAAVHNRWRFDDDRCWFDDDPR